jgi:hypothetical protein
MTPTGRPPEIELGKVLLGSGEFRLVYWPIGFHDRPMLMLGSESGGAVAVNVLRSWSGCSDATS